MTFGNHLQPYDSDSLRTLLLWSDVYDRTAEQSRFDGTDPVTGSDCILQREIHPSAEYADDVLPFFSDRYAASYRLSCIIYGMKRLGGVTLNPSKLHMMPVQLLPKMRLTARELEDFTRRQIDLVCTMQGHFDAC
eukprot:COSAG02_NODE_1782_length_10945_cov_9.882722_2_plen_135_part_00